MSTIRNAMAILLCMGITACATSYIRYINPHATQDQFMKDRYDCYTQTQQRISNAYINQYGGAANSQVIPSCSAFQACLAARGYYRSDTTNAADLNKPGSLYVPAGADVQCTQ